MNVLGLHSNSPKASTGLSDSPGWELEKSLCVEVQMPPERLILVIEALSPQDSWRQRRTVLYSDSGLQRKHVLWHPKFLRLRGLQQRDFKTHLASH